MVTPSVKTGSFFSCIQNLSVLLSVSISARDMIHVPLQTDHQINKITSCCDYHSCNTCVDDVMLGYIHRLHADVTDDVEQDV